MIHKNLSSQTREELQAKVDQIFQSYPFAGYGTMITVPIHKQEDGTYSCQVIYSTSCD